MSNIKRTSITNSQNNNDNNNQLSTPKTTTVSSSNDTSSTRRRQKLNAITEKIRKFEDKNKMNGITINSNSPNDNIVQQQQQQQHHPGWSTVDTMRELNELVQSELNKLTSKDDGKRGVYNDHDDNSDQANSKYQV